MATRFKLQVAEKGNGEKKKSNLLIKGSKFFLKAKMAMHMRYGLDVNGAAKLCNVSEYQLGLLRTDPEFEEFIEMCALCCESEHLENIKRAGDIGQWQASAWVLERRFPDKYGKKDTIKHEYEVKLHSFQKIVLEVINDLEPNVRQIILQKLRNYDIETEVDNVQMQQASLSVIAGGK